MAKNKSKIAGVIAAAAIIAFSATSCGDNGGGGFPGGQLGDGPVTLSGQVYSETYYGYHPFSSPNPVAVTAQGLGGATLGAGQISPAGHFSITLTAPAGGDLVSASELANAIYYGASVVPADTAVQGTRVWLNTAAYGYLNRHNYTAAADYIVFYVFVNGPVTVNIPQSQWTAASTLNLAAGWNAILDRLDFSTDLETLSVANPPNLRWVFWL